MKAKKLKSGSYNVLVYSHTENGKRIYQSFTAPTKSSAERMAAEFRDNKQRQVRRDMTVGECIDGYVRAKEGVLSPSTIRGYVKIKNCYLQDFKDRRIRSLTNEDMQSFISQLAMKYSPKTVKNIYGLLTASISMYDSMIHFVVTLPPRPASRPQAPDVKEIQTLYNAAGPKMKMYIYLAMCGLRRGEICAIKYEDIKDGVLHIHADMVLNKDNKFVYKEIPKTAGSDRYITLPGKLLEQIGEGEGFVVKCNPSTLSNDFRRFKHRFGITLRLHDMRHYFASAAVALGIPDIYTADMGGWSRSGTSSVMKEVYQNNIKDMSEHYQKLINDHIEKIVEG